MMEAGLCCGPRKWERKIPLWSFLLWALLCTLCWRSSLKSWKTNMQDLWIEMSARHRHWFPPEVSKAAGYSPCWCETPFPDSCRRKHTHRYTPELSHTNHWKPHHPVQFRCNQFCIFCIIVSNPIIMFVKVFNHGTQRSDVYLCSLSPMFLFASLFCITYVQLQNKHRALQG